MSSKNNFIQQLQTGQSQRIIFIHLIIQNVNTNLTMSCFVGFQRSWLSKCFRTPVAGVRPFARMNSFMPYYVALMLKALAASLTNVGPFVGVGPTVGLQVKLLEEGLSTVRAYVIALFQMVPFNVLLITNKLNKIKNIVLIV